MVKNNRLKIILAAVVVAMLATGIATGNLGNGDELNGNEPNGVEPNGNEPNGDEPNGIAAPDLTSGFGIIIDCDDNPDEDLEAVAPAVDFRFQDAVGTTFSLSDFRGRLVMLNFWTTWCSYCVDELPSIQQIYDQWPATELVLLTIDKGEDFDTVATFMQDEGYGFPIVMDEGQQVSLEYGVTAIPTTFFIDEEGIIQAKKVGYFHTTEDIEDILNQIITTGSYVAEPEPEPDSAGLGFITSCPENPGDSLEVGDLALDFQFQDAEGLSVSLSDFRGKPIMVCFWASWCPYCNKQLPYLQQLYDEWQGTELVMMTISKGEEPSTVATFMQDEGLSFPVITDSAQKASSQYGVSGVPTTFFIDEDGIVQFKKVGYFHSTEDIEDILNQLFDW